MRKVIAILLALAMTGTLILFCVTFISRQIILPAMNENGASVSDSVIRQEQQLARERVIKLAELYGFDAEPVIALLTEETLIELNSQASQWWSTLLQEGKAGKELSWETGELEEILASDARLQQKQEQTRQEYLDITVAEEVRNSIIRMVLPMRAQTIRLGMQEIGKRADLPNLISFLLDVPWAALAFCSLLAGLIVLTANRKANRSLLYIGSSLGGAAIVLAVLMILYLSAGILPMIREASEGLAIQYQSVASAAMTRAGILTAMMAAGCILCLARDQRNGKTA